ncbi:MAG: TIM barrel protein, partial [Candidatus Woesearchaeota archaeon]
MKILIGPGGTGSPAIEGLREIAKLGLTCVEVEFTHSIYMKNNKIAKEVGDAAKELGLDLSVHCPYYINLLSAEKPKITASMKRILVSAERGHYLGAKYIIFHAGYYGKLTKEQAFEGVKKAILEMQEVIKKNKWNVMLAPETTGKSTQFGDLDELYRMHKETGCAVCVDFAHMKAKYLGKIDYKYVFDTLKKFRFRPLTAHFSGIEWGAGGEKRHVPVVDSDIRELLKWIIKYKLDIRLV